MDHVRVHFKRLHPKAVTPAYMSMNAAGVDLSAVIDTESIAIAPGARLLIGTGLAIELPLGYEAQVRPRSGLALKFGITVLNSPGTIDADYRGELKVVLINHGQDAFAVRTGDRIAQLVVAPVTHATFEEQTELSSTDRGAGGYGHTGV